MTAAKALIASSLISALVAGCDAAVEALPLPQAQASAATGESVSPYGRMHDAIPAGAGGGEVYEYQ